MPIASQPELFTNSNHVSREGENHEGQGPVQSGGDSNSQPSVFKVVTEPDRPNHQSACPNKSARVREKGRFKHPTQQLQSRNPNHWSRVKQRAALTQSVQTAAMKEEKDHETDEFGEKGVKGLHCLALSSTQPSGSSGEMKKKKEI